MTGTHAVSSCPHTKSLVHKNTGAYVVFNNYDASVKNTDTTLE